MHRKIKFKLYINIIPPRSSSSAARPGLGIMRDVPLDDGIPNVGAGAGDDDDDDDGDAAADNNAERFNRAFDSEARLAGVPAGAVGGAVGSSPSRRDAADGGGDRAAAAIISRIRLVLALVLAAHLASCIGGFVHFVGSKNAFGGFFFFASLVFGVVGCLGAWKTWRTSLSIFAIGCGFLFVANILLMVLLDSGVDKCVGEVTRFCDLQRHERNAGLPWIAVQIVTTILGFALSLYMRRRLSLRRLRRRRRAPEFDAAITTV
jgi:hypothetical protein